MLYIASDHAGYTLRVKIEKYLQNIGIPFYSQGAKSSNEADNYAEIGAEVCPQITEEDRLILICGSGIGISIIANRFSHIRAGLVHTAKQVQIARAHNNINAMVLAGRTTPFWKTRKMITTFLVTEYEKGRHEPRINTLSKYGTHNN